MLQWVRAFSAVFGQYGLGDHIDGHNPPQGDSDWVQNDCAIVSWLYNRLSPDLLTTVSTDDDTAYSLWHGIRDLFRSNRSTRSVYLNSEFRTFLQGDLSILAYCTRMKTMADRLGDLGTPITNNDLVQNIIRGLNPRFHNYVPHLTGRRRLPAFHKAHSKLQMEEHRLDESDKLQAASALVAQAYRSGIAQQSSPSPPVDVAPPGNNARSSSSTSTPPKKKRKKPASTTGTTSSTPRLPASTPAPTGFSPTINPWTGMVQACPMPPAQSPSTGLLGAHPPSLPQAHVASNTGASPPANQMDPQLLAALTNLSLQHSNTGGDWFLDTGASSHMASGSGILSTSTPTPLLSTSLSVMVHPCPSPTLVHSPSLLLLLLFIYHMSWSRHLSSRT